MRRFRAQSIPDSKLERLLRLWGPLVRDLRLASGARASPWRPSAWGSTGGSLRFGWRSAENRAARRRSIPERSIASLIFAMPLLISLTVQFSLWQFPLREKASASRLLSAVESTLRLLLRGGSP